MAKRASGIREFREHFTETGEKNRKNGLFLPAREANVEAGAYLELI